MNGLKIPFTGLKKQYHNLRSELLDATDQVLRSGQLLNGNHTAEFENWLAKKNNTRYAVTCHSGTQALEILARFHKRSLIAETPTVLLPSFTYIATANAFINAGWNVVFADCNSHGVSEFHRPEIWEDNKIDLIVLVGIFGKHVNDPWEEQIRSKSWKLSNTEIVEDGAQHWLSNHCRRVGSTAISFDPMKNLNNYGNGGAVVTNDSELASFAQHWRNNSKDKDLFDTAGTNSRMSETDCAQLMVKTQYIDEWQDKRRKIAGYWIEQFKEAGVETLITASDLNRHAVSKFVIQIENRNEVQRKLDVRNVETKIHYQTPLHERYSRFSGPDFLCTASALARRTLSLPIYPELTDLEVEYIADQVIDCVSFAQTD